MRRTPAASARSISATRASTGSTTSSACSPSRGDTSTTSTRVGGTASSFPKRGPLRSAAMRAVLCKAFGPPESLVLEDVPAPSAGPGQVVVDMAGCGVNYPDFLVIQDKYQFKPPL